MASFKKPSVKPSSKIKATQQNPLPGRKPSKAFMAALHAVANMQRTVAC